MRILDYIHIIILGSLDKNNYYNFHFKWKKSERFLFLVFMSIKIRDEF